MADSNSEPASPSTKPIVPPTLLTLPVEIRNYIYDLAIFNSPFIGAPRPVQLITVGHHDRSAFPDYPPTFISTVTIKKKFKSNVGSLSPFDTPHNLFSTCRQIRQETRETYYSCNTFIVRMSPDGLLKFMKWLDSMGQDAQGFLRTLLLVFIRPGKELLRNTEADTEMFLLDITVKGRPRIIKPARLCHAAELGDHQCDSSEAFEAAIQTLPVFRFLMDDPCYKVPRAAKIQLRDEESHELLEQTLYDLWWHHWRGQQSVPESFGHYDE
ncbi:hypothetical protein EG328_005174 [Venturia inaequalis]|uniref:Uncharacterized protein n=1 Tax=Venturia inaequalis TaxID=5025 RepID=A0A8H3UK30_VENIN|nr:hypothetical protein EG328_005174 [Venturia inaequalis]